MPMRIQLTATPANAMQRLLCSETDDIFQTSVHADGPLHYTEDWIPDHEKPDVRERLRSILMPWMKEKAGDTKTSSET